MKSRWTITSAPTDGKIRFALRYYIGDVASNGDYLGIDFFQLSTSSGGNLPTVTTGTATSVTTNSAVLNGTINPNGLATTYTFAYGTSTNYDNFEFNLVEINGNDPINVSANISDLSPNTLYHFQLTAENSAGITDGGDVTFITNSEGNLPPTAVTNGATNISTTTATLNGTINPNGLNTNYYFEYGTSTSYGSTKAGTTGFSGSTNVNVSGSITGLNPNTTYHYRIVATNSAGTSNGSDVTFLTSSTSSGVNLRPISLTLSTFNWQAGNSINADITIENIGASTASASEAQLYLSENTSFEQTDIPVGSTIPFNSITAGNSQTQSTLFSVPTVNPGVYLLFIGADINGVIAESDENDNYNGSEKIIIGYPSTIQINTNYSFNDPEQSSSYRMIGLPGNSNIPLSEVFTGNAGEDWIAYFDNGSSDNYLIQYDGSANFNFKPGKGFWALSNNQININQSVNSVAIESKLSTWSGYSEVVHSIDLNNGWNIISNPFEQNVNWSEVQYINNITESIHTFNGSYSTSTALMPYQGYYFLNVTNLSSLNIPYPSVENLPKSLSKDLSEENEISVSLLDGDDVKSIIKIGFNDDSKIGYDKYDGYIPPADFDIYRISVFNENLETDYKYLAKDYRRLNANQTYDIYIKYPVDEFYKLNFDGLDYYKNLNVYLVDQSLNFHEINLDKTVSLVSINKTNKLQLLIGDQEFIHAKQTELTPTNFSLSQNYPNPFNPNTKIIYSIPKESFVLLRVYDMLGKEIMTLVNDQKQPGRYEVNFEGSNLSSGIYFYTLNARDPETSLGQVFSETKKMILLQ